jgi:hypothetical protein
MTSLIDKNHIIMPFSSKIIDETAGGKYNFLENFIINDNILYHPSMFQYYIFANYNYNKLSVELIEKHKIKLIETSITYLTQSLKAQRNIFRELTRSNKLELSNVITFIKEYYNKVNKINTMLIHCQVSKGSTYDPKYRLGKTQFIIKAYNVLCSTILEDHFITILLKKSIHNNDEFIKQYSCYIKNYDSYVSNFYKSYLKLIGTFLYDNRPTIDYEIKTTVRNIYLFNHYMQYLNNCYTKYYYLVKDDEMLLSALTTTVLEILSQIIQSLDTDDLIEFTCQYKNDLLKLQKYDKLVVYRFIDKQVSSVTDIVNYYNCLLNFLPTSNTEEIISTIILGKLKLFDNSDNIKLLALKANNNIINDTINNNQIIYMLGHKLSYKDEFIKLLEYNLMQRLLYHWSFEPVSSLFEVQNYVLLSKYFTDKELYKYNIILDDYSQSYKQHSNKFVLIASQGIWDINFSQGSTKTVCKNGTFTKILYEIHQQYRTESKNQFLINYPHLGMVDITIRFNSHKQKTNIIMLPAHMMFLELFCNGVTNTIRPKITIKQAFEKLDGQNLSNYPIKFINNIISSFIIAKLVEKSGENYVFNENYVGESKINLINIFNQINSNDVVIKKVYEELAYTRNDIISCSANHYLKKSQLPIKQDILVNMVINNIKAFKAPVELINTTLNKMEKDDYIQIFTDKQTGQKMVNKLYY